MGHGGEIAAPLAEADVQAFEERHEVRLPEGYRAFLTQFANGGAGPGYGVFPLGLFDGSGDALQPWADGEGVVGRLGRPFPLARAWNLSPSRLQPPVEFESDSDEDRWHDDLDAEYWRAELVDGAFPICHHGCALRSYLVVSGPERGNVWLDRRAEYAGIEPHTDDAGRHLTFLAWYERWIEGASQGFPGSAS